MKAIEGEAALYENNVLTEAQAYEAMYAFLDAMHRRGGSVELGAVMGWISTMPDGTTADPATAADWREAVDAALTRKVDTRLRPEP